MGTNVLFGISPQLGAVLSGALAIGIFVYKEASRLMDRFTQMLGFVMIALTIYVMFTAQPPVGEAAVKTFAPDTIDFLAIVTLVGGTVGGYITFAGGHRLIDAGLKGKSALPEVTKSSVYAIGVASIMRIILFLAVLGVISQGFTLDEGNPPASVFQLAAGNIGYKIFGVVFWAAAITSVVGAAYTSVSFIRSFSPVLENNHRYLTIGFITISTLVFAFVGEPVSILVLVGSVNGLILPLALGVMLVAAHKAKIVGSYKHPVWMTVFGALVVIAMAYMGVYTLIDGIPALFE